MCACSSKWFICLNICQQLGVIIKANKGSFKGWNPSCSAARAGTDLSTSLCPCCLFSFEQGSLHFIWFRSLLYLFIVVACYLAVATHKAEPYNQCLHLKWSLLAFTRKCSALFQWHSNTNRAGLRLSTPIKGRSACSAYSVINMKKARLYLLLMFI